MSGLESNHPSLIFLNHDMLGECKRKAFSCVDTPRSCRAYLRVATHEKIHIKYLTQCLVCNKLQ